MAPSMPPAFLGRRALLTSGTAFGAAGLAGWSGTGRSAAIRSLRPMHSDRLVRRFGVVVHLHFLDSVYVRHDEVLDWLRRLGVRHVRTRLSVMPDVLDAFEKFARHGVRIHGVCGAFGDDQSMDEIMRAVSRRFDDPRKVFSGFEGINEPNNDGVAWVAETRRKTRALHAARARHGLREVPIVAPALARVNDGGMEGGTTLEQAQALGDLSRYLDYGNMHVYPRGLPPSNDIGYFRRCAREVAPSLPVMCTEGGYFTAMDYQGGANAVPPPVAAAYAPQAILQHWAAGTRRFFRYELLDEPDVSSTDREGTFGMISTGCSWTPKQDFWPVRELLEQLEDPGPAFRPGPARISLSRGPRDLRRALFAKRDGSHVLALWLDRPIYEPRAGRMLVRDLAEPIDEVRLELGSSRNITVRHLTDLDSPARQTTGSAARVALTAGVTLVTLADAPAPSRRHWI